jgi:RNA polymerase sigma-70 factor, ECF subfamily
MAKIGPEQESLDALVRRARDGSAAALETLICRFQVRVTGFIYSLVGNDEAVEDVCHNVFVKMISSLACLKRPASFESWLFRIARNACTDFLRKRQQWRMYVPFGREHEQIALAPPGTDDRIEMLRKALGEMPRSQRELILLLADKDWSYEQLAGLTGTTLSSVKSRLFRAREFLRQRSAAEDKSRSST